MKTSQIAINIVIGVVLSGLVAPLIVLLPETIRYEIADTLALGFALACIALVFYLRRNKSNQ